MSKSKKKQEAKQKPPSKRTRTSQETRVLNAWKEESEKTIALLSDSRLREVFRDVVGLSEEFRTVIGRVIAFSGDDAPVYIYGETGTGKERLASAIHDLSERSDGPYVACNCAQFADTNLERSELFGHERGAFTGAVEKRVGLLKNANRGTLFLDEIGLMRPATQGMLNKVMDQQAANGRMEIVSLGSKLRPDHPDYSDVRIVSAFNKPILFEDFVAYGTRLEKYEEALSRALESQALAAEEGRRDEQVPTPADSPDSDQAYDEFLQQRKAYYDKPIKELMVEFEKAKESGQVPPFNDDFAHRVCQLSIAVSPLRIRPLDAIALTHFYAEEEGIELEPMDVLCVAERCQYGNARGIRNCLKEYRLLHDTPHDPPGATLDSGERFVVPEFLRTHETKPCEEAVEMVRTFVTELRSVWGGKPAGPGSRVKKNPSLEEIVRSLFRNDGSAEKAALELEIGQSTLRRILKEKAPIMGQDLPKLIRAATKPRRR